MFLGSFALRPSCSERVLLILFLVGGFNGVVLMLLNNRLACLRLRWFNAEVYF